MRGNSIIISRFLLRRQFSKLNSLNLVETLICSSTTTTTTPQPANTVIPGIPLFRNYTFTNSSEKFPSLRFQRRLCSSPDGPSNIILIKTGEEFNSSLGKVKDESLPTIFYFTAAWCGPCRFISPVIGELSAKYPHVTIYKIDIDQAGLESALNKLNISAVPTILFFQNGEKVAQVVGADVSSLKTTMDKLYKED